MSAFKTISQQKYLPKTLERASPRDRFMAHSLDALVLILFILPTMEVLGRPNAAVGFILYYAYYIVGHKVFGATIGKKIIGVFVLSIKSESLTWSQVILRETVCKWISAIILMYGFIRIFIYGVALHDELSETTVVCHKKEDADFLKPLGVVALTLLISVSSCYYLITRTELIGIAASKFFEHQGHKIKGLKGNLKRGWTVESWRVPTTKGYYEFSGVRMSYNLGHLYESRSVNIKEISISRMNVKLISDTISNFDFSDKRVRDSSGQVGPTRYTFQIFNKIYDVEDFVKFVNIEKVNLKDVEFTEASINSLKLKNVNLHSIKMSLSELSLGYLQINDSTTQLKIWDSRYNVVSKQLDLKTAFNFKKGFTPVVLRPIVGQLQLMGKLNDPNLLKLDIFDGRLKWDYKDNKFLMKVTDLTPYSYLKYFSTVSRIHGVFKGKYCRAYSCFKTMSSKGKFTLHDRVYNFLNSDVTMESEVPVQIKLLFGSFLQNLKKPTPLFFTAQKLDLEEFIAKSYYKKSFDDLSEIEIHFLKKIKKDYLHSERDVSSTNKSGLPSLEDFNK